MLYIAPKSLLNIPKESMRSNPIVNFERLKKMTFSVKSNTAEYLANLKL